MIKLAFDDPMAAANQLKDIFAEDQELKETLFSGWTQNIHYLNGQQAIEWDQTQRRYKNVPITNKRKSRPRIYITNEIEPGIRVLVSFLTRNKPQANIYPEDPTNDDSVRRARMAEIVQEATWDMDHEYERYVQAAYWLFTVGTVFRKDFWDSSARGQVHFQGPQVQIGTDVSMPPPDLTGDDSAIGPPKRNWGDMGCSILTPFQMAVDFSITEFSQAGWVMEYSLQKVDWVKEQYNQDAPGFTRMVDKIKEETSFGRALNADLEMRFMSVENSGKKPTMQKMCVLLEFYQAPSADMPWNNQSGKPRGRQVISTRDVVLYDGPSLYDWHPYTCAGYEPFLGRFWKKSLVEQVVAPQRRLNEINGAILENSQKMANPQWLIPDNTVAEGLMSGQHGLRIPWKPQPHGFKPEQVSGIPLPQQYFNERQSLVDTITRIMASNAVMQGQAPSGISSGVALQMLLENAQNQHGPLINEWELFIERSQTKKLRNFQRFCREPRPDMIKLVKNMNKKITDLDIFAICGDDLEENVNIKIEAGSSIPKSQAAKQAQLAEFAKAGWLGDMQDPIVRQQFLSEFGITEFDRTNNAEWEKIQWENSLMQKGLPPSPSEDDIDPLHIPQHISETQRPSFIETATPQTKKLYSDHIAWHKAQAQKKTPPPPPPAPPKVNLNIAAKATPQEVEQAAGLPVIPPPMPQIDPNAPPSMGLPPRPGAPGMPPPIGVGTPPMPVN